MLFHYFVSYNLITADGESGVGRCEVTCIKEIEGIKDISEIEKSIMDINPGCRTIFVTNFIRL